MNRIKIMLLVFSLVLITSGTGVYASESLSISLEKTIFYPFEDIVVHIELTNDGAYPVVRYLQSNIFSVNDSFVGEFTLNRMELESGEKKTINYTVSVLETMPASEYVVDVKLLTEDLGEVLDEKNLSLEIMGTKKIIDITILSCKDAVCSEVSTLLFKDETIYLDYDSPVSGLQVSGIVRYPDDTTQSITLPTSLTSNKVGTHNLELTATKTGYKTKNILYNFAIIEEDTIIPVSQVCNENGICDEWENYQNCPQDCMAKLDSDGDDWDDERDNCPDAYNSDQLDTDNDGEGNACDPVANAGADQTVECTSCLGTEVTLDGSGSHDPNGDLLTYTWTWDDNTLTGQQPTATFQLETTTVTLTVSDGQYSDLDTVDITIVDTTPPDITCPADVTLECPADTAPSVTGEATATDTCGDVTITYSDVSVPGPGNTETITRTWTATDECGNSSSCVQTIAVVDTTPPTINSVSADPDVLWSPNHKMVEVTVTVDAEDICDPAPVCNIVDVTSNEPINGPGDGNTESDWEFTDDLTVNLRAERAGSGNGRVYTIHIECTDASDNTTTATVEVTVPHDQGKGKK